MIDIALERTLVELAARLEALQPQAPWCVIGSAALVLSGVDGIVPNDVDVLLDARDAYALIAANRGNADDSHVPSGSDRFRSRFARLDFAPMPVEVMGGLEVHHDGRWQAVRVGEIRRVALGSTRIPVPELEEQLRLLEMFGREKDLAKARALRRFVSGGAAHVR